MSMKRAARPTTARRSKRRLAVAVLAVIGSVLAASVAYRRSTGSAASVGQLVRPSEAAGFNLLLVTLDTVRQDRLGCYGDAQARTPTLDALAEGGVQFDHAVTPTPLTLPSHATMMTGLTPPRHGVCGNGSFRLAQDHVTLAETLKKAGYDTAAFIACFVLDERFGLNQGFDLYDFEVAPDGFDPNNLDYNERPADAVSDAAIRWLSTRSSNGSKAPFFMWVHYFDAHKPYRSPYVKLPEFAGRPYDAEIAYVDSQFKRLLDTLDQLNLRKKTVIAVVSDHGEGLGEHDEPTHGLLLYDTTVRVVFLLSCPELIKGPIRIDDRPVSLEDLFPTLVDLLGVPATSETTGISLVRASPDPDRAIYIETKTPLQAAQCSPLYGIRRLGDKYVRGPEPEYFDLLTDSGEQRNLIGSQTDRVGELDAELTRVMGAYAAAGTQDGQRAVSEEELRRLAALGYVHAASPVSADDLPDPKAMLRANRHIGAALQAARALRLDEALRLSEEAVRLCPGFPDASEAMAIICEQRNDPEGALAALQSCFAINPKSKTAIQMARVLMTLDRYDEMESLLDSAERLDPANGVIYILRGDRYSKQGRLSEAITQYEQALRVDEHRVGPLVRPQIEKLRSAMRKPR